MGTLLNGLRITKFLYFFGRVCPQAMWDLMWQKHRAANSEGMIMEPTLATWKRWVKAHMWLSWRRGWTKRQGGMVPGFMQDIATDDVPSGAVDALVTRARVSLHQQQVKLSYNQSFECPKGSRIAVGRNVFAQFLPPF